MGGERYDQHSCFKSYYAGAVGQFCLQTACKGCMKVWIPATAVSVCAPAGYGKTTLAVSYFIHQAAEPCRIAWYRLDPEDNNTPVFIAHLTEALFPSEDAGFAESRQTLESRTDLRLQPHQALIRICREMWALHSRADHSRTYLVLDDFQNVAQNQDIGDITRYMLDNLPPSWSIFVLSRALHDVFTEKQKLEKRS